METLYFAHPESLATTAPSCVNVDGPAIGSYPDESAVRAPAPPPAPPSGPPIASTPEERACA